MLFELFKTLGAVGIIVGAAVWLIRKIAEQFFVKDLEKFKSDLEKEAIRYQVQFEGLYAERAVVIKEVYRKIVKTYRTFSSLLCPFQPAGDPTEEEKRRIAMDEGNDLIKYFSENRIYFEEELAKDLDNLMEQFRKALRQFDYAQDVSKTGRRDAKEWNKAWEQIRNEVPPIKEKIEKKFRNIIGISGKKKTICQK